MSDDPGHRTKAGTLPPDLADHPDYQIVRELGRGGMGVVYLAHNRLMGRDEVLKVVSKHLIERKGVLERFSREIRSAARLDASQYRARLFRLSLRRERRIRHGICRWTRPGETGQVQGADVGRPCLLLRPPGRARAPACPRAGDGPPRHQARQPDARPQGGQVDRQSAGLRPGQGDPRKPARRRA